MNSWLPFEGGIVLLVILTTSEQVDRTMAWVAAIREFGAIDSGVMWVVARSHDGGFSVASTGREQRASPDEPVDDVTLALMVPSSVEVSSDLFGRIGTQVLEQGLSILRGNDLDIERLSLDPGYAAILIDLGDFPEKEERPITAIL
jgi:hypothetical protein